MKIKFNKNHTCSILLFFTGLISAQKNESCKGIYGKWEVFKSEYPFGIQPKKKALIWTFNEDGTVFINDIRTPYNLSNNCSILKIDNNSIYTILKLTNDTLYIKSRILTHESYNYKLKKIN